MTKTPVTKSDYTVTSAFIWEDEIASPGKPLSLTKAQAIPLEQRGKIKPGKPTARDKAAAKPAAKPAAKSDDE